MDIPCVDVCLMTSCIVDNLNIVSLHDLPTYVVAIKYLFLYIKRVSSNLHVKMYVGLDLHVNVRSFRERETVCPRVLEFVYGIESECGWGCV